jgi:hypothetical protein
LVTPRVLRSVVHAVWSPFSEIIKNHLMTSIFHRIDLVWAVQIDSRHRSQSSVRSHSGRSSRFVRNFHFSAFLVVFDAWTFGLAHSVRMLTWPLNHRITRSTWRISHASHVLLECTIDFTSFVVFVSRMNHSKGKWHKRSLISYQMLVSTISHGSQLLTSTTLTFRSHWRLAGDVYSVECVTVYHEIRVTRQVDLWYQLYAVEATRAQGRSEMKCRASWQHGWKTLEVRIQELNLDQPWLKQARKHQLQILPFELEKNRLLQNFHTKSILDVRWARQVWIGGWGMDLLGRGRTECALRVEVSRTVSKSANAK